MDALLATLVDPFLDPTSRTWWGGFVAFVVVGFLYARPGWAWRAREVVRHKSTVLDLQLLIGGQLLRALVGVPVVATAWTLATHGVRWLDGTFGAPALDAPTWAVTLGYTAVLFLLGDLSRFLLHLAVHKVPRLWELHQVHHSAEVLTPLTFHRLHPLEARISSPAGSPGTEPAASTTPGLSCATTPCSSSFSLGTAPAAFHAASTCSAYSLARAGACSAWMASVASCTAASS